MYDVPHGAAINEDAQIFQRANWPADSLRGIMATGCVLSSSYPVVQSYFGLGSV
jgi:hypothetical protein